MAFAWIFIIACWIAGTLVWAWPMLRADARDFSGLEIVLRTFAMMAICFGSLWVPDLWL